MNLIKRHLPAAGLLACLFLAFTGQRSEAANPSWWMSGTTQIIETSGTASNYSPANLGQLKFVAKQAKAHLDAKISGGAGSTITTLVNSFEPRAGQGYTQAQIDAFKAENYQPINLGQLKAVAKPFYDRLLAAGYNTKANLIARGYPSNWAFNYPWDPATPVADNYVPANLGQLKMIFSFDLEGFDADLDGLPDAWELLHFGNTTSQNGSGDADGDGVTNLQEFQNGTAPKDYYNGTLPTLQKVSGDAQVGEAAKVVANPLVVKVMTSGSVALANAPVTFSISGSNGQIATSGTGTFSGTQNVVTGTAGTASIYLKLSGTVGTTNQVQARVTSGTNSGTVTFSATTRAGAVLTLISGNNQVGPPSTYVAEPGVVEVRSGSGGALLINEPVLFSVASGSGALSTTFGGTTTTTGTTIYTGTDGRAQIYYRLGSGTTTANTVAVTSGTAGSATISAKTTQSNGLWARWKFDEGTGTSASDATGLTVSGTLLNGVTWSSGTTSPKSVVFSGTKYVTMGSPSNASLDFGKGNFTMTLWVKYATKPSSSNVWRIWSKGHRDWGGGYLLALRYDGGITAGIGSSTSTAADTLLFKTTTEYNDGQWHHVAFVADQIGKTASIYVDGVAQALAKDSSSGGTITSGTTIAFSGMNNLTASESATPLTVSGYSGSSNFFTGEVYDARIYRKALSTADVQADYNSSGDGDSLPDWWEWKYLQTLSQGDSGNDDGDSRTNLQEYQNGSDPKEYYNGAAPVLQKVSGDAQVDESAKVVANPLVVKVMTSGSVALGNAPVTFSISGTNGQIATSGTGPFATTQSVVTATTGTTAGIATIYLKLSGTVGATNQVQAQAISGTSTASVTFSATTRAGAALSVISGNNQVGPPSTYVVEPLVVEVRSGSGGALLINEPVLFTVASGSGKLSTTFGGTVTTTGTTLYTGTNGRAQIYHQLGSGTATVNTVSVTSGTAGTATFTAKTTLADGLWAKWKLDEGTGTTVADSTGLTVSGTLVNSPSWDEPGYDGRGGMKFLGFTSEGGSNAYVTMGNPSDRSLDFGQGSFSISVWVKYTDGTFPAGNYGRRIISKGHAGFNPGYTIVLEGDGRLWTGIGSTLSSYPDALFFYTQNEFDDGKWHHVVTVFDRQASTARIYVDGVVQPLGKESPAGGTIDPGDPTFISYPGLTTLSATRTDTALTVSSITGVYDFFKGGVDDVSFYRKALSGSDVTAIYNSSGDGDSLPDWWEWKYLQTLSQGDSGNDDGDSRTNLQEYQNGSDPKDYYNGAAPILQKVSGDAQVDESAKVLANPLVVKVTTSGSVALGNAPVTFSISGSNGQLSTSGTGPFASTQTVVTATTGTTAGTAAIYLKLSGTVGATNQVLAQATSGTTTASVTFSATTRAGATLSVISGNNQAGPPSTYVVEPLVVEVRSGSGGALLINEPVLFTVASGSGKFSTTFGGTVTTTGTTLYTGTNGRAQIYHQLGSGTATVNTVSVTSGTAGTATFTAKTTLADGLWAKWKLDEGTGTTVADSTGLTVSGTLVNSPSWDEPGYDGRGGMKFLGFTSEGGSNAYVTMGNPSDRSLDFGQGSFSISVWVKYTDGTHPVGQYGRRIVSKGHHGHNPGYTIVLENDGRLWTGIGSTLGAAANSLFFRTQNEFNDDKWHHVVTVFDRAASTARVYVDGVVQPLAKDSNTGGTIDPGDPTVISYSALPTLNATRTDMPLTISSHMGIFDFFKGGVDDVSFYRKALSASDVEGIYNSSSDGDSLPDWWEWKNLGTLAQGNTGDDDQDGQNNLAEYTGGTDPKDYYNGTLPSLQKLSGDGQTGEADTVLPNPLVVQILSSGSAPLNNAPVTFSISGTNGQIASSGTGAFGSTLDLTTGTAGTAAVYLKLSGGAGALNPVQAQVTSGTSSSAVIFNASTPSATLSIVSGNDQKGRANEYLSGPLIVGLKSGTAGTPSSGTPVTFAVTSGTGGLATQFGGTVTSGTLTVNTGSNGRALAYYKQAADAASTISVTSGTSTVEFSASRAGGNAWSAWSFDDGYGTTALETTGLGGNGTLINDPLWSEGFDGTGGVEFTGSNSYVTMGQPSGRSLDLGTESFTVAFWVRYTEVPGSSETFRIVSKGFENFGPGYFIGLRGDGKLAAGLGSTSGTAANAVLFKTTGSFNDGEWHAVAAVYDRTNSVAQIYVDGTAQSLEKEAGTGGTVASGTLSLSGLSTLNASGTAAPFTVASFSGSSQFFQGELDQVEIHKSALGTEAIEAIYNADLDGNEIPDWWEYKHFKYVGVDPDDDDDRDGLTNSAEYEEGSDPRDYYSQGATTVTPVITMVSGNNQTSGPDQFLAEPFVIEVRSGTTLLDKAPVVVAVASGSGDVAGTLNGVSGTTRTVYTGSTGRASAWYRQGSEPNVTSTITAQAGSSNVLNFVASTLGVNSLVAHWKFDEGIGTTAADSAPFVHTGTLINGPAWQERFVGENSLSFSGTGAHVLTISGTDGMLDFADSSFSVTAWIKTGTAPVAGRIISKGNEGATPGYYLALNSQGQIETGLGTNATGTTAEIIHIKTTGSFNDDTWHAVAAVYDRKNSSAKIYVDGTLRTIAKEAGSGGTLNISGSTSLDYPGLAHLTGSGTNVPLSIASQSGTSAFFKGSVDEVRVYRKALSAQEVSDLCGEDGELVAVPAQLTVPEDTLGTIVLQSRGGGTEEPEYEIVTSSTNGVVDLSGATAKYYAKAHFSGTDQFRFRVTKGPNTAEANVSITVTPVNDPPLVSVGGGRSVTMSGTTATLALSATVTDIDTDPEDITLNWMKASGTGTVVFSGTNPLAATATFSAAGDYLLRLSANDGTSTRSDSLVVTVNPSGTAALPVISLAVPNNDAVYEKDTSVVIQASASAASGLTVTKVEFFANSQKIGEDTAPDPISSFYDVSWTSSRLGIFLISAKVTDSAGGKSFSNSVQVRVTEDGWFTGPGDGGGNEGFPGSGGNGGIPEGAPTGPGSNYGPGSGEDGGGNAPGSGGDGFGNPAGSDPSVQDSDGDGLTNSEENEIGTNPSPGGEDTDGDGVNDGEDGWALEARFAPERLASPRFVVVPLAATGGEAIDVNDKGGVVFQSQGNIFIWKDGVATAVEVPSEATKIVAQGITNDDRAVVAYLQPSTLLSSGKRLTILWSGNGSSSSCKPQLFADSEILGESYWSPLGDEDNPTLDYYESEGSITFGLDGGGDSAPRVHLSADGSVVYMLLHGLSTTDVQEAILDRIASQKAFSSGNTSNIDSLYELIGQEDLASEAERMFAFSTGFNSQGIAAGDLFDTSDWNTSAAFWKNGEKTVLHSGDNSIASGISENNHIFGSVYQYEGETSTFWVDANAGFLLDQPPVSSPSYVEIQWNGKNGDAPPVLGEMNSRFQFVGDDILWMNSQRLRLDEGVGIADRWQSVRGNAINQSGVIAASAVDRDNSGARVPVLLVPFELTISHPEIEGDDAPEYIVNADIAEVQISVSALNAADDSVIEWEILEGTGSLSEKETLTSDGFSSTKLKTSRTAGGKYKIRARVKKLKLASDAANDESAEFDFEQIGYENVSGIEATTAEITVVPGCAHSITVKPEGSAGALKADGRSEITLLATLKDKYGQAIAEDTPVIWHAGGSGDIEPLAFAVDSSGQVRAKLIAGTGAGQQKVRVEADGFEVEETFESIGVTGEISAQSASLDMATGQSTVVTASFPGVANGASVRWFTSRGELLNASSTVQGGQATATLRASSGRLGTALVTASVGGVLQATEVEFTSSEPISVEVDGPVIVGDASTPGSVVVPRIDGGTDNVPYTTSTSIKIKAPDYAGSMARVEFGNMSPNVFARYRFDEVDSGMTPEAVSGLDATVSGAILDALRRHEGVGSLHFDGEDDILTIPDNANLRVKDGFSVSVWIYAEEATGTIVEKNGEYRLYVDGQGRVAFSVSTASGEQTTTGPPVPLGQWVQVRGEYSEGRVGISIGGSRAETDTSANIASGTSTIVVGDTFKGWIDSMVFSRDKSFVEGTGLAVGGLVDGEVQLDSNGEATLSLSSTGTGTVDSANPVFNVGMTVSISTGSSRSAFSSSSVDPQKEFEGVVQVATKQVYATLDATMGKVKITVGNQTSNLNGDQKQGVVARSLLEFKQSGQRSAAVPFEPTGTILERIQYGFRATLWLEDTVDGAQNVKLVLENAERLNLTALEKAQLQDQITALLMRAIRGSSDAGAQQYLNDVDGGLLETLSGLSEQDSFRAFVLLIDGKEVFLDLGKVHEEFGPGIVLDLAKLAESQPENPSFGQRVLSVLANYQDIMSGEWKRVAIDGADDFLRQYCAKAVDNYQLTAEEAFAIGYAWGFAEQALSMMGPTNFYASKRMGEELAAVVIAAMNGSQEARTALMEMVPVLGLSVMKDEAVSLAEQGRYFDAGKKSAEYTVGSVGTAVVVGTTVKASVSLMRAIKTAKPLKGPPPRVPASFGRAVTSDYRKTFFDKYPNLKPVKDLIEVHHAVEQTALEKYPSVVTESKINSIENLRGIRKGRIDPKTGKEFHRSTLRKHWNAFYRMFRKIGRLPTEQELLDFATDLDDQYGHMFVPPVR